MSTSFESKRSGKLSIRTATPRDAEFAYLLLEQTMRGYAIQTFGAWDAPAAKTRVSEDAKIGRSQIIELGGQRVGLLCVDQLPTHHQLDQLYIAPRHQGKNIGASILSLVLAEAHAKALPVRIRVLRVNPAKRFYERHGFVVTNETPERFFMENAP